jgi:hypothetical protein
VSTPQIRVDLTDDTELAKLRAYVDSQLGAQQSVPAAIRFASGTPTTPGTFNGEVAFDEATGIIRRWETNSWVVKGTLRGQDGAQGPTGPAGAPGATGAQGPQGPTGPQGATGTGITYRGNWAAGTYVQGDAVSYTDGHDYFTPSTTTATPPAAPWIQKDLRGPTGATGPTGPQGTVGATGPIGPQGPIGATGPQGDAGTAGRTIQAIDAPDGSESLDVRRVELITEGGVAVGYFLRGDDNTWGAFYPYPVGAGVTTFVEHGDPSQGIGQADDQWVNRTTGRVWFRDPDGWPTEPQFRLMPADAQATYWVTKQPPEADQYDLIYDVERNPDGTVKLTSGSYVPVLRFEDGDVTPPPNDPNGQPPDPTFNIADYAPPSFAATTDSGGILMAYPQPGDTGLDGIVDGWIVEAKATGAADSSYAKLTANLTSSGVAVPSTGKVPRVGGTATYSVRDATVRTASTALTLRLVALDATGKRSQPSAAVDITTVATTPQLVGARVGLLASSSTLLPVNLPSSDAGNTPPGSHPTDLRTWQPGDLALVTITNGNTGATALPATLTFRTAGSGTGGVTFTRERFNGTTDAEFRTDPSTGVHIATYKRILQSGDPTIGEFVMPVTGAHGALMRVYDATTTYIPTSGNTVIQTFLAGTFGTTTTVAATANMPYRAPDVANCVVEHVALIDTGTSAGSGLSATWTGATKLADSRSGGNTSAGRILTAASAVAPAKGQPTNAASVAFNPTLGAAPRTGAVCTIIIRPAGAVPDPTVVQPDAATGGVSTGGGGGGGGPVTNPTGWPVPDRTAGVTWSADITSSSVLKDFGEEDASAGKNVTDVGHASASKAPWFTKQARVGTDGSTVYTYRISVEDKILDAAYTHDAYRSEIVRDNGSFPQPVGAHYWWGGPLDLTGLANIAAGKRSGQTKSNWQDIMQGKIVGTGNGPLTLGFLSERLEIYQNSSTDTSAGTIIFRSPVGLSLRSKIIKVLWRIKWSIGSDGIIEFWADYADGAGLTLKFTKSGANAKSSTQAVDQRHGIYTGPNQPAGGYFESGRWCLTRVASPGDAAAIAAARALTTRGSFGESL